VYPPTVSLVLLLQLLWLATLLVPALLPSVLLLIAGAALAGCIGGVFKERGFPANIRSDNGVPFGLRLVSSGCRSVSLLQPHHGPRQMEPHDGRKAYWTYILESDSGKQFAQTADIDILAASSMGVAVEAPHRPGLIR
jgi:hypothetical protein